MKYNILQAERMQICCKYNQGSGIHVTGDKQVRDKEGCTTVYFLVRLVCIPFDCSPVALLLVLQAGTSESTTAFAFAFAFA